MLAAWRRFGPTRPPVHPCLQEVQDCMQLHPFCSSLVQQGERRSVGTCAPAEVAIDPFLQLLQGHLLALILAALDVGIDGHHKPRRAESTLTGMMPCKLLCASGKSLEWQARGSPSTLKRPEVGHELQSRHPPWIGLKPWA